MEPVEFGEGSGSEIPGILPLNGTGPRTSRAENAVGVHLQLLYCGRLHGSFSFSIVSQRLENGFY